MHDRGGVVHGRGGVVHGRGAWCMVKGLWCMVHYTLSITFKEPFTPSHIHTTPTPHHITAAHTQDSYHTAHNPLEVVLLP